MYTYGVHAEGADFITFILVNHRERLSGNILTEKKVDCCVVGMVDMKVV